MKINSNYINENFNNSRQNSKTTKQDKNSLWDVSFKTLLKEVEEFVESKMKKYKEELVLNKKTGEYEKKKVLDEEAYKEHLRLKLEEQTKEKISTQINEKIEQKLNSNLEKQASINNNLNLKTKENISYMQIQAQEKYHAKNSPTVFSKKQEKNNKNLFNTFSAPVGSSV